MTREEAIKFLELDKKDRGKCIISDAIDVAIKALEQEPIIDKIRAEIDIARFIDKDTKLCKNSNASGLEVAMQIIDKYKSEGEKDEIQR